MELRQGYNRNGCRCSPSAPVRQKGAIE
jgi:hypothetical protein